MKISPLLFPERLKVQHLIFFLVLAVFANSCSWFQPAKDTRNQKVYKDEDITQIQGKRVFDTETGTWRIVREVNEKVDTVEWKQLPPNRYPPIKSDGTWSGKSGTGQTGGATPGTTPSGNTYNVSLLLPFLTQISGAEINSNSLWGLQFYAGARLAYDNLKTEGVNLNISVIDTEGEASKMATLLRSKDIGNADLVIGPYKRENVTLAADFSKKNKVPLVVPFTASMGMAEDNPYYIQVNPSLKSHCRAITQHARKSYRTEDIVLVARNAEGEKERISLFQDANAEIEGRRNGSNFREMIISDASRDFSKIDVSPYIRSGRTNVFIVPSWTSEPYVYSLLRALMVKRSEGEDIVVYGMPQWLNFEQIDFEFYEKLKVHISSSSYVDENAPDVRLFRRRYFDTYGTIPSEEAYLGYDILLYFGKSLKEWGREFSTKLDARPYTGLQSKFNFQRIVLNPERSRENLNYFDQIENTFVYILKFRDFQFQPAN